MANYKPDKFNFSRMSERVTFQTMNIDNTYTDDISVWAHISKDGFTRSETDNWYRVLVREQRALDTLLSVANRLKWKNTTLSIFSWDDPLYEHVGFIEIMAKQIATATGQIVSPSDGDLYKDVVSVYRMTSVSVTEFGLTSFKYQYDFTNPVLTGLRCSFSTDRNSYLDNKKTDVEHDALIVKFNIDAPIQIEDYIVSPIHGRFKVDMIVKNLNNELEAHVQRSDVQ